MHPSGSLYFQGASTAPSSVASMAGQVDSFDGGQTGNFMAGWIDSFDGGQAGNFQLFLPAHSHG